MSEHAKGDEGEDARDGDEYSTCDGGCKHLGGCRVDGGGVLTSRDGFHASACKGDCVAKLSAMRLLVDERDVINGARG